MLVLTTFDADQLVLRALQAGVAGFLLKDCPPADIVRAIETVHAGDGLLSPAIARRLIALVAGEPAAAARQERARHALAALTPREHEVATAVAQGLSNADIAGRLYLSQATVKAHVSRLLVKLEVANRVQVALLVQGSAGARLPPPRHTALSPARFRKRPRNRPPERAACRSRPPGLAGGTARAATQKLSAATGTSTKARTMASACAVPRVGMMLTQASHSSSAPVIVAGIVTAGERRSQGDSGRGQAEKLEQVQAGPGHPQMVRYLDRRDHGSDHDRAGNQEQRRDDQGGRQPPGPGPARRLHGELATDHDHAQHDQD